MQVHRHRLRLRLRRLQPRHPEAPEVCAVGCLVSRQMTDWVDELRLWTSSCPLLTQMIQETQQTVVLPERGTLGLGAAHFLVVMEYG